MSDQRIIITVINNLVSDNRVHKMAGYLENRGYEVWMVGRTWPGGQIPSGRPGRVFRFKMLFHKGVLFYLCMNIRLFLFLTTHRCNRIVAVDLDTLPACVLAGWLKRILVIMDSHELFTEIPELQHRLIKKRIWQWIEAFFIRRISAGITVSPGLVKIYKERYNKEFLLVRNVPDITGGLMELRATADKPTIYYQGALNVGRGLESAIKALVYLPGYRMVIVGDGDIASSLRQMAVDLRVDNRVVFVGKVPFEDLHKYIIGAHIGLCLLENIGLNYYHSLPNRIFDYPLAGLPVLASAFPDISEVVSQHETGLLTETLDPQKIAELIKQACEDFHLRHHWSRTLPQVASKLNWEKETRVLNALFPIVS